jgi:hypothetical protein
MHTLDIIFMICSGGAHLPSSFRIMVKWMFDGILIGEEQKIDEMKDKLNKPIREAELLNMQTFCLGDDMISGFVHIVSVPSRQTACK